MAHVLALLASGRTKGFTATLLRAAVEGAESVEGVEVEWVHLNRYTFKPCASCFSCIRSEVHECTQKDAMGGEGELMAKLKSANGWILADPVHCWGPSAQSHLFIERCYPFLWSGDLEGMPFASISCASNQGMQQLANENLCKWAFTSGFRYVGGLPVHTTYFKRALPLAEALGCDLATAACADARGREKYPPAALHRLFGQAVERARALFGQFEQWHHGIRPLADRRGVGDLCASGGDQSA